MSESIRDFFNPAAAKIVNYTDLADRLHAAYKGKLTLKERVYLNTIDPLLTMAAVAKMEFDMGGPLGHDLRARNADGTLGIYEDKEAARLYYSTETLKTMCAYDMDFSRNKAFSRKAWKIMEGLVDAAPDCTHTPEVARAKRFGA